MKNQKFKKKVLSATFYFYNGIWRLGFPSASILNLTTCTYEEFFSNGYANCVKSVAMAFIIAEYMSFEFSGFLYTWHRDKYNHIIFRIYDVANYKVHKDEEGEEITRKPGKKI